MSSFYAFLTSSEIFYFIFWNIGPDSRLTGSYSHGNRELEEIESHDLGEAGTN